MAARSPTPLIKVCGLTRPVDAERCVALGVDLLGVILAESPRRADLAAVREIRQAAPQATLVGVLVNPTEGEAVAAVEQGGVDVLQLHGNESEERCVVLGERTGRPVVQVVRSGEAEPENMLLPLLFDLRKGAGNDAEERDRLWAQARDARDHGRIVILAGGLDPANVAAAVAAVQPHGVDVSRGVEAAPGIKEHWALERFVREVRGEHSD